MIRFSSVPATQPVEIVWLLSKKCFIRFNKQSADFYYSSCWRVQDRPWWGLLDRKYIARRLCRIRTIKYYYNSEHEGFKPLPSPWNRHSILSSFYKYALISEIIKQVCCKSLRELHLQCQNNRWRWRQRSVRPEYKIHVTLCKHRAGESGLQSIRNMKCDQTRQ